MKSAYGYFRGKALEDMTREELMEAIVVMSHLNTVQSENHLKTLDTWQKSIDSRAKIW